MRVAVNARLLASPDLRGWNRYTINLLAALAECDVDLLLYGDRPLHPVHLERLPVKRYELRIAPPSKYTLWEQYWLPRQCGRDHIDILHCPMNFGLPAICPCPRVLTLHDAIDQIHYGRRTAWHRRLSPGQVRNSLSHWVARTRAERVITVSDHSGRDLVEHLHIPRERISIISEAADPIFHAPVSAAQRANVRREYGLPHSYIFYVGGWEQRKNIPFLLRAFAEAALCGVDLVLAGGRDEQKTELARLAAELGMSDRLRLIGWVPDSDLPALYSGALCFVYPSLYEGFGLQLCEAMAVGCPTLAAHATCLPEVLGSGGDTFNPSEPHELAGLLQSVAGDEGYRRDLSRRAQLRSQDFCWRGTAEQTLEVYRRAVNSIETVAIPA